MSQCVLCSSKLNFQNEYWTCGRCYAGWKLGMAFLYSHTEDKSVRRWTAKGSGKGLGKSLGEGLQPPPAPSFSGTASEFPELINLVALVRTRELDWEDAENDGAVVRMGTLDLGTFRHEPASSSKGAGKGAAPSEPVDEVKVDEDVDSEVEHLIETTSSVSVPKRRKRTKASEEL